MKNKSTIVTNTESHPDITWENIRYVVNRIRVLDEVNPKAIPRTIDAIRDSIYELLSLLEKYDVERKNV